MGFIITRPRGKGQSSSARGGRGGGGGWGYQHHAEKACDMRNDECALKSVLHLFEFKV